MRPLEELDLNPESHETRPFERPPDLPPPAGRGRLWALVAGGLILVAVVGYFLFLRQPAPPQTDAVVESAPPTAPPPAPAAEPERRRFEGELPPLDASDEAVAAIVSTLSSHPRLLTWLATPSLIRTFAVMIENVASNHNPSQHLGFLDPEGEFEVSYDGGALHAARSNERRYDLVAAVFSSLDPAGAAAAYEHLKPLLEEAYADLGYPKQAFEPSLEQAFANVLAIRIPTAEPELEKDVANYVYVDPQLEALGPLSKQLLRMGPANARRIQGQVRRLADALGMDVP